MNTLKEILLYIWQLPQNLIGLVYMLLCFDRVKVTEQNGAVYYATKHVNGGLTLGRYVFIEEGNMTREPVYDHEAGHVEQSKVWGWLWLFVFGIPSLIHNLCYDGKGGYYNFYTEKDANRRGGIPDYNGEYHHHEEGIIHTCYTHLVALQDKYFKK